jgi:uncharacterized protein YqjF (DUF2071 family)
MAAHDFDTSILEHVSHRPWAMPDRPWIMTQTWHDLLFAHWPVDSQALRAIVPSHFELDLWEGGAWIGVVPFYMTNVAPRGVPALPWVSEFPELNVRTYVRVNGRAGVYFFSLDADNTLAVRAARTLLNLPYYSASMTTRSNGGAIDYEGHRDGPPRAEFRATYEPIAAPFVAAGGSVEYFLTERYCLYNVDRRGVPYRLEIHHPPWRLQAARADIRRNSMADASGVALPDLQPLLHFSKRQDMVAWAPTRLRP